MTPGHPRRELTHRFPHGFPDRLGVVQPVLGTPLDDLDLMGDPVRRGTATTTVAADAIEIKRKEFLELARREDARLDPLQKDVSKRVIDNARMQVRPEAGSLMNFLMREGLGEATNVLLIDESLCVAATPAKRPAPKRTAGSRGSIAKPERRTRTCTFPPLAATASSRIA